MKALLSEERRAWIKVGATQGTLLGGKASGIYTLLVGLGMLGIAIFNFATSASESPVDILQILMLIGAALLFGTLYLGLASIVGVMPSVCIGAISGALLGACLSIRYIHAHRWNCIAVGLGIALIAALQVNLVLMPLFDIALSIESLGGYFIFLGAPTLVYVATLVRLSDQLPDLVRKSLYHHETPVYPY